jgi:hypothetical protein
MHACRGDLSGGRRLCNAQVTRPDLKIGVNARDRSLDDWLQRCDEANHEAALELKRDHTHHAHSLLGGKGVLTDKEITAPEDELASQVSAPNLASVSCCACIAELASSACH